jgi:uncharacterized protein (TIGR03382 family)
VPRAAPIVAAVLGLLSLPARAHVRLVDPVSRYGDEMKAGPCGRLGGTRTTFVTTRRPGDTITVVFDEIIDHPGYFRIAFDPAGDAALAPPTYTGTDWVNPAGVDVLLDRIANPPGLTHGEVPVVLPDIECDTCTLQLIQVMTDKPPFDGADDFYYQCADLVLSRTLPVGGPPPPVRSGGVPAAPGGMGGCASAGAGPEGWLVLALLGLRWARRRAHRLATR